MPKPNDKTIAERFLRVVTSVADGDKWHYSRMSLELAQKRFNELGLVGYQLIVKAAVSRDKVGLGMRTNKQPGIYFRVERVK